jgi:hypothetical protein
MAHFPIRRHRWGGAALLACAAVLPALCGMTDATATAWRCAADTVDFFCATSALAEQWHKGIEVGHNEGFNGLGVPGVKVIGRAMLTTREDYLPSAGASVTARFVVQLTTVDDTAREFTFCTRADAQRSSSSSGVSASVVGSNILWIRGGACLHFTYCPKLMICSSAGWEMRLIFNGNMASCGTSAAVQITPGLDQIWAVTLTDDGLNVTGTVSMQDGQNASHVRKECPTGNALGRNKVAVFGGYLSSSDAQRSLRLKFAAVTQDCPPLSGVQSQRRTNVAYPCSEPLYVSNSGPWVSRVSTGAGQYAHIPKEFFMSAVISAPSKPSIFLTLVHVSRVAKANPENLNQGGDMLAQSVRMQTALMDCGGIPIFTEASNPHLSVTGKGVRSHPMSLHGIFHCNNTLPTNSRAQILLDFATGRSDPVDRLDASDLSQFAAGGTLAVVLPGHSDSVEQNGMGAGETVVTVLRVQTNRVVWAHGDLCAGSVSGSGSGSTIGACSKASGSARLEFKSSFDDALAILRGSDLTLDTTRGAPNLLLLFDSPNLFSVDRIPCVTFGATVNGEVKSQKTVCMTYAAQQYDPKFKFHNFRMFALVSGLAVGAKTIGLRYKTECSFVQDWLSCSDSTPAIQMHGSWRYSAIALSDQDIVSTVNAAGNATCACERALTWRRIPGLTMLNVTVTSPQELVLMADVGWAETCGSEGSIGLRIVRIAHNQVVEVVAQTYFWGFFGAKPPLSRTQVWQGTSRVSAGRHVFAIEFLTNTHDTQVGVMFCTAEFKVEHKLVALTMPDFAVTGIDPQTFPEFPKSDDTKAVSVAGFNFGTGTNNVTLRMGFTSCASTVWTSESSLHCQAAAGMASNATLTLTVDGLGIRTKVAAFDYARPSIAKSRNSPAISDSQLVQLQGSSFGLHDYSPTVSLRFTVCERTVWIAATSLNYVPPSGIGVPSILVNVSNHVSIPSSAHSFDRPVARSVHPQGGSMSGYFSLTLTGANFGAVDYTLSARLGNSKCLVATWTSDSSLTCLALPGAGTVGAIPLSFSGEITSSYVHDDCGVGCLSKVFTYDRPEVASLLWRYAITPEWVTMMGRTNGPVAQETTISIFGNNFGPTAHTNLGGRVGATACVATKWGSNTKLTCRVASGLLPEQPVVATAFGQSGTMEKAFSYDPVRVRIVGGFVNPGFNGPVVPISLVSLQGVNFGSSDYSPVVRLQETACAVTQWISDSSVNIKTPGVLSNGRDLFLTYNYSATYSNYSIYANYSQALNFRFSMDIPEVERSGTSNLFVGMGFLNISGANFGTFDATVKVNIASSDCEATRWNSDNAVKCKVPAGVGEWKQIVSTVVLQPSKKMAPVSFDSPQISSIFPVNGIPIGQSEITIWGRNFGIVDYSLQAFVGSRKCRRTTWVNATMVTCKTPAGLALEVDVTLKGHEVSNLALITAVFTYDGIIPPGGEVINFWRSNGPPRGQVLMVMTGTFRAPTSLLLPDGETPCEKRWPPELPGSSRCPYMEHKDGIYEVYIGHSRRDKTACLSTTWIAESTIMCYTPPGVGDNRTLFVRTRVSEHVTNYEIMESFGIFANVYSYDAPIVSASTQNVDNHSPRRIAIAGTNFGSFDTSPRIRLALSAAESTRWVNDVSLAANSASGVGSMPSLVLTMSEVDYLRAYTVSNSFRFDLGASSGVVKSNSPPSATNIALTLAGCNFGRADYSAKLTLGHTVSPSARWIAETSVVALVPQGVGGKINLSLAFDQAPGTSRSVLNHSISYDVPIATDMVRNMSYSPFGGTRLSITGSNFGAIDYSARGWVGDTECVSTVWNSDSSLLCTTPAGTHHGKGPKLALVVDVANQVVLNQPLSTLFQYDRFGAVGFSSSCPECVDIGSSTKVVYNTFDYPLLKQPVIETIDPFGTRVPYYMAMVTVNLVRADGRDTLLHLSGSTVRPIRDGLVYFTDLYINGTFSRGRYQLEFRASNMTTLYGGFFDILKVQCSTAMAGFSPTMLSVLGDENLFVKLANFYPTDFRGGRLSFFFEENLPPGESRAPARIQSELVQAEVIDSPIEQQINFVLRSRIWNNYPLANVFMNTSSVPCFQVFFVDFSRPRVQSLSPAISTTDGNVPITLSFMDGSRKYSVEEISKFEVQFLDDSGQAIAGGRKQLKIQSQLPNGYYGLVFETPSVSQPGYYDLKLFSGSLNSQLVCCAFQWYGPHSGMRVFFEPPRAQVSPTNVIPHVTASKVEVQLFFYKFKYGLSSLSDVSLITSQCKLFGNGAPWAWVDTTAPTVSVPAKGGAKVHAILPHTIESAGSFAYPLVVSLAIDCSGTGFLKAVDTGARLFVSYVPSVDVNKTAPQRVEVYGGDVLLHISYFPFPLKADSLKVVLEMPSGEKVPPVEVGIVSQTEYSTALIIKLPMSKQNTSSVPGPVLIRAEPQQGPEGVPLSVLIASAQVMYFQPDPEIKKMLPGAAPMEEPVDVVVVLSKILYVGSASSLKVWLNDTEVKPLILQSDFLSTVFLFTTPIVNQPGMVSFKVTHADLPEKIGASSFAFTKKGIKAVCRFSSSASISAQKCPASTDGSTTFEILLEGFDVSDFESNGVVEMGTQRLVFARVSETPFVIKVGIPAMDAGAVMKDGNGCPKPEEEFFLMFYSKSDTLTTVTISFHYRTPPCLSRVAFIESGSYIFADFNQITNQGGISGEVPCTELFTVDGSNSSQYWGKGGTCFWVSPVRLRMNIGSGRNSDLIQPGQVVSLAPWSTVLSVPAFPTKAVGARIVGVPSAFMAPTARISGPTLVGTCPLDQIWLKGQATSPREVTYFWTSSNNRQLDTRLATERGSDVMLDPNLLTPGVESIIQLQVADFLGTRSTAVSHRIMQTAADVPRVKIEGSPPFLASQSCYFIAIVRFSSCQTEKIAIQFDWIVYERDSKKEVFTSNAPSLEILKGKLLPSTSYVVSVEAGGVGQEPGSAFFEFATGVSELVASIALGNRMHPRSKPLVLDAVSSHDLDICQVKPRTGEIFALGDPCFVDVTGEQECSMDCKDKSMSFEWKCTFDGLDCRLQDWSLLEIDNAGRVSLDVSKVNMDPPTLPLIFSVRVAKGNRRKSASVEITVVDLKDVPYLNVIVQLSRKKDGEGRTVINQNDRLLVAAETNACELVDCKLYADAVQFQYSMFEIVRGQEQPKQVLSGGDLASIPTGLLTQQLIVNPGTLFAGKQYAVKLKLSDRFGTVLGLSGLVVVLNDPPSGGGCLVTPSTGVELQDIFTVQCSQWMDEDLPLSYMFGFDAPEVPPSIFPQVKAPAQLSDSYSMKLPGGRIQIQCTILDAFQCSGAPFTIALDVSPASPGENVLNDLDKMTESASKLGDASNLVQSTDASAGQCGDLGSGGERRWGAHRHLLASSAAYRMRMRRMLLKKMSVRSMRVCVRACSCAFGCLRDSKCSMKTHLDICLRYL